MNWQPIKTAPKDRRILIWATGGPMIAFWATFYSPFYRSEVAGWWTSIDPRQGDVTLAEEVSYWAPIEPPQL